MRIGLLGEQVRDRVRAAQLERDDVVDLERPAVAARRQSVPALDRELVATFKRPVFGPIGMEQLWNRGGATGGKRSALRKAEIGLI
jgi:hypothetical protein